MQTFQVSEVVAVAQRLPELSVRDMLEHRLGEPTGQLNDIKPAVLEACASNLPLVLAPVFGEHSFHPLLAAVHLAFAQHYRLILSPDDIWLCLAQGFALHVEANAEALRTRFVRHAGKLTLEIQRDNFVLGSPDNDWQGCFAEWSDQIAGHIGKKRDLVVADFSTTGTIERAASEVVLMSAMKSYFDFGMTTMCGIPDITLLGTVADWQAIRRRAELFAEFDLGDWVRALLPVLDQFVRAASGTPDHEFWRSLYKLDNFSGGPYVTGWINVLFPYLDGQPPTPIVSNHNALDWRSSGRHHGTTISMFPCGMSNVPLAWNYLGRNLNMTLSAGFVGIAQDAQTHALRSAIGWAVRYNK